ncbi:MAG: ankyrin repeat domain-containing protein [Thiolinea sp.]
MACSIVVACQASVAQAGFFQDLASIFGVRPAPESNTGSASAPAAQKPVVSQPPQNTVQPLPPQSADGGIATAADKPTVQTEPQQPAGPTQKDLNEMLWLAALQGNEARIRGLVEQGANPSSGTPYGETPLHVAASRGHLKPIIYLANHGGSVNARTKNGWTPLHHAARFGHYQAVKYLLHMGAIPHIRTNDKGRKSPMEMAVDNGYLEIAALLGYRPR